MNRSERRAADRKPKGLNISCMPRADVKQKVIRQEVKRVQAPTGLSLKQ